MNKEQEKQGLAPSEKVKIAGLVDFQEGAVVSRTIMKKETGTVTLFAFDKDQGLSEHTAPFDAMVNVLDGEAEFTIEGTPFLLTAGESIIMPAGKPHSVKAVAPFKMLLVMIRS
jgi:quercetin dioxygenase-like cupin family protein